MNEDLIKITAIILIDNLPKLYVCIEVCNAYIKSIYTDIIYASTYKCVYKNILDHILKHYQITIIAFFSRLPYQCKI